MAPRSTRSSTTTGTTRRRRRVRKDDDTEAQTEAVENEKDDASDVIFDEPAEEEEKPKPKRRRKKAASRRRKTDDVQDEAPAEPTREPADDYDDADDRESTRADDGDYEQEREDRDERDDRDDGDGPPRRRRRRRRGRRSFENRDGREPRDSRDQREGRRGSRGRGGRGGGGGGGRGGNFDRRRHQGGRRVRNVLPSDEVVEGTIEGVLELHPKRYGFLRDPNKNYVAQESDPFVPSALVEKFRLYEGVLIKGEVGPGVRDQGPRLHEVETIDGLSPEEYQELKRFDDLTPITPHRHICLETDPSIVTMRVMDMLTPVGKGQRALIVAPPRTGKTMLLQDIANAVSENHPEMELMVLLIDERPEEVTEMRRKVKGEVIASSMDRDVESHVRMSQLIIERAKRMTECGKDVFVLMDSITRMARAFNKWIGGGGGGRHDRGGTMSGGLHVKALDIPKKLFGTARQFEEGGSLTIVATALIETNSKQDDVIFQEFKGTGNMELVLSRDLADRRIWPAIDITRSGTRHEEKLFSPEELDSVIMLRRSLISLSPVEAMEQLTRTLERFPTNSEFLARVKSIL